MREAIESSEEGGGGGGKSTTFDSANDDPLHVVDLSTIRSILFGSSRGPKSDQTSMDHDKDDGSLLIVTAQNQMLIESEEWIIPWSDRMKVSITDNSSSGDPSSITPTATTIVGALALSTNRLFFCSEKQVLDAEEDHDRIIHATAIELHALAEHEDDTVDLPNGQRPGNRYIYLQFIENEESNNGDNATMELSISPEDPATAEDSCQRIFDALSRMVALHPLENEEEDDDTMYYGDDMIVAVDEDASESRTLSPPVSTEEERNAMLERLDAMLEVPPECDMDNHEGKFDDASDDADLL